MRAAHLVAYDHETRAAIGWIRDFTDPRIRGEDAAWWRANVVELINYLFSNGVIGIQQVGKLRRIFKLLVKLAGVVQHNDRWEMLARQMASLEGVC